MSPEIEQDTGKEVVTELSDKIDTLLIHDERQDWLPGMREFCVDAIFAAVHSFASANGIATEDRETRLELVIAIDSQLRFAANPNPFQGEDGVTAPAQVTMLPRLGVSVPAEQQMDDFFSAGDDLRQYAEFARKGYEELRQLDEQFENGGVY